MKRFLILLFCLFSLSAQADNVLLVHQNYNGTAQNIGARLVSAGHTVTYTTTDPTSLTGYQQVWDVRYSVSVTGSLATLYDNFIKNSGYIYLTAENPGCCQARDNSVAAFISNAGGGSTTIGGTAGSTSNTLSVVNTSYMTAGTTVTFAAGAAISNSQGTWLFKDTAGKVGGMMWVGNAGNLGADYNGTILVVSDINWTDNTYYTLNNKTAVDDIIAGVVAGTVGGTISSSGNGSAATVGSSGPTYSASISIAQQTRVNAFVSRTITNNNIYIDQVGDNNTVNITQVGNNNLISGIGQQSAQMQGDSNNITVRQGVLGSDKNEIDLRVVGDTNTLNINQGVTSTGTSTSSTNGMYQSVDVNGYSNIVTTQQTNTGGVGGHYMETTVNGNQNNILAKQTDNGNKTFFTTVNGNNNTVNATQSGTGQHYLETILTGDGNSALVTQSGNLQNRASISITNAGGPGSVDLQQTGDQVYNVTTSCVTAGGCAPVVLRQGN